jgi:hypothetical protein
VIGHTFERALAAHRADDSIGAQPNLGNILRRPGRLDKERVTGVLSRRDWTS